MKRINPNLLELAKKTCNPDTPMPDLNEITKPLQSQVSDIDGFVYVPSINLYVAKERKLHNNNWEDTHKELKKQGYIMLTIHEFVEFLKYVKINNKDVYNDITKIRDPWRAEWLDSYFEQRKDGLYLLTENKTRSEKLETCLMDDKTPGIDIESWLNNANKQGLPINKTKKGDLYYWYPRDGAVARFNAVLDRADLSCDRDPQGSDVALGVRHAKIKE